MLPTLSIGPFVLPTAPLILLGGLLSGLWMIRRQFGPSRADTLENLVLILIISGLVGARIGYALQFPDAFFSAPLTLLILRPVMLLAGAGWITAGLAGAIFLQRKGLSFWETADALTPLLASLFMANGLANFADGNAYGVPTTLPWAVHLSGTSVHPVQLYEAGAALIAGLLTLKTSPSVPGRRFLLFAAFLLGGFILLAPLRAQPVTIYGGLSSRQVTAWILEATTFYFLWRKPWRLTAVQS